MVVELGLDREVMLVVEYSLVVVDDVVEGGSLTVEVSVEDSVTLEDPVTMEVEASILLVELAIVVDELEDEILL